MAKIPEEYIYAWHILREHKYFNRGFSDDLDCMRAIANQIGGVNFRNYRSIFKELKSLSNDDFLILKKLLEEYDLYVD